MSKEWVEYRLLHRDGREVRDVLPGVSDGRLMSVESCQISGNVNRQIRWTGRLALGISPGVDWSAYRIAPIFHRADGVQVRFGVFIVEPEMLTVREHYTADVRGETVTLHDRTKIVADDLVDSTYTISAGTKITTAVNTLIRSTGETGVSITDRADQIRTDLIWDPGTAKLRVINDLLAAAGFFALHTNTTGQFRLVPYEPPATRPVVRAYRPDGAGNRYAPTVETEFPETAINRMILKARGDGDAPDLLATASDQEDYKRTGRWRTGFDDSVEATSQVVLNGMAARRLSEARQAMWTRTRTVPVSELELNAIISGADGGREVVEEIETNLAAGALMTVKTRGVRNE